MKILLSFLAATFMITGQSLWKKTLSGKEIVLSKEFLFSREFLSIITSINILVGAFMYALAMVLVFYLFSKYPFYLIQSSILVFAIIISITISKFFFHENITILTLLGFALLLLGIFLIYQKSNV